ncbi:hypothetical protein SAMN04489867_3703 [Pedococcus dokdonensis]|uniref:Lipoprotein LprG n=1 Tax=Pedococcus dokdonensis TaxID=443156 RepID=A0A1H0V7V3_9MICO|nr:hypothetical protein [Pedococcus dokdonensis]SDP74166.1 hypothetical protein SAMN04489867_3703 [Pedococcus dokdonensis]
MKKTMVPALALVAALGLSACGDAGDDSGTKSSTSSTSSSGSAASGPKAGATVDGADLAAKMTAAMVEAGSGTISMDLGTEGKASGAFSMKGGVMEQQMTMPIEGQTMEIVSTGGIIYMKGLPGSKKPWVKIDPKADDPISQMFAGMTGDMGDPRQLAKALEGSKATVVSSTGDSTTYDVTIDPKTLLGGAAATAAPSAEPVKARYTLDAKDLPTSMVVEVQGQKLTISFGDWGKPVSIKAPPADRVGAFELPTS